MRWTVPGIRRVLSRLDTLPGVDAQLTMAPLFRRDSLVPPSSGPPPKPSSVLLAMYPGPEHDRRVHLMLTERSRKLSKHSGQISFPGGRIDEGEDAQSAAIREAREEVNLIVSAEDIVTTLTPLYIPPTRYLIHPHVALLDEHPEGLVANPDEVHKILHVPVDVLLHPETRLEEPRQFAGLEKMMVPYYAVDGGKVWGATAIVLAELLFVLRQHEAEHGRAE